MIRSLYTASTGMQAQELSIDVIAHNLANVNTTGFKKSRAEFQDLFYQTLRAAGTPTSDGGQVPSAVAIGQGTRPVATATQFSGGDLLNTGNPTDVAIEGRGFFRVMRPDGQVVYTRAGNLKTDAEGRLVTADGFPLDPPVTIPTDAVELTISAEGLVTVRQADQADPVEVGNIELSTFVNPGGLQALGRGLFQQTAASGEPQDGAPGQPGFGTLAQGFTESSNVKVVEEMIGLISAQRAYEVNSKVIQAADQMLRQATSVR
jgi:flagellar basal-body rod protein FlgG